MQNTHKTRDEVIEIVKQMPGVTANEVIELMPHVASATVASMLSYLKKQGLVAVNKKVSEIKGGKFRKVSTFTLSDGVKPIPVTRVRTPTDAGLRAQIDELHAKLAELQAWKDAAIARFPDLAVPEIVDRARKLVAEEVKAGGDLNLAAQITAGLKDNTLMVRVALKALEEAA